MDLEKTGLSKDVISSLKNIADKYNKYRFYIFGSRAKGTYKKTSDIDIAVFEEVTDEDKFKIMNEFDLLNIIYKVDLVFINEKIKKELLYSIKENRIKL